jgi:hypothetical protein
MVNWKKSCFISIVLNIILILSYNSFASQDDQFKILLKSRHLETEFGISNENASFLRQQFAIMKREYGLTQIHTIIQLTHIPDKAKKVQLRNLGIELLSYIPNNAWYAAITLPAESVARQKEMMIK